MQTPNGTAKAVQTIYKKYGKSFFMEIGKIGGKKKNPLKGFGSNKQLASTAGAAGGKRSRRRKV